MATRSKKFKGYETKWKVLATVLFFMIAGVVFFTGIVMINISETWHKDVINAETVYDTKKFQTLFSETLNKAARADVLYQSEDAILSGERVNRDSLINSFKRYYDIVDGVITENTAINDTYDGLDIYGDIPERLHSNLLEYQALVEVRLPQYYKMYIQNQLDEYKSCVRYLNELKNFLYYVEDGNGNIIGGNAAKSELNNMERTLVISSGFTSNHLSDKNTVGFDYYVDPILEDSDAKICVAMRDTMLPGDDFYDLSMDFNYAKQSLPILFTAAGICFLAALCCLIFLIRVTGQTKKNGPVTYMFTDKLYNEVHAALVVVFYILAGVVGNRLIRATLENDVLFWNYIFTTLLGVLYTAGVAVGLSFVLSMARQIKGKRLFRNTWLSVTIRRMSELFTGKTFRGWMVLVLLCYGLGNCVGMGMLVLAPYYFHWSLSVLLGLGLVAFNALAVYLFLRALRSLKLIMISAKETSKGNFSKQLDLSSISPSLMNFAEDVENIQDGLKHAVDDAVKGERMKTELITNVSHDLKTPLTSIINYVELLKNETLINQTAKGYVDVLYDKSYRLKQLIEDLIEASKASSGNLTVAKMRLEYKQLFLQALGEMEAKTTAAGLVFKTSSPDPVFIDADGRHMWRILENLLSNVVKYAMQDSRVYVDIFESDGYGVLIMKNISASPIDFDETRLTERFVRGDASRSMEGSGLGLSITQSLAEIQGGSFCIQVDGDLFKAIVSIPLWAEPEQEEDEAEENEEQTEEEPPLSEA